MLLALTSLQRWSEDEPTLQHIFQPVQTWLKAEDVTLASPVALHDASSSSNGADTIIDALLVMVQSLLSKCPAFETDTLIDNDDNYMRNGSRFIGSITRTLGVETIYHHLLHVVSQLESLPQHDLQANIKRLLPFLDQYTGLVDKQMLIHSRWTQALFKLDFVVCSVMYTIAKQGFCKPQEEEDGPDGDSVDTAGGVGMGEGSGTENVSKEIEDESQVEGMQGEQDEPNNPRNDAGDDNTIEMSEDFGGALEDVPDSASQDGEESEEESQQDPEEQLGDLDASDPSAVDEKLWGDESAPNKNDDSGKINEERSDEKDGKSDVVAKEGPQAESKEDHSEEDQPENISDDPLPGEDAENEAETDRDQPEANGAPIDDNVQDANTLDIPDDIDLGLGEDIPDDMDLGPGEDVPDDMDLGIKEDMPEDSDGGLQDDNSPESLVEDSPEDDVQGKEDGGEVEEPHSEETVTAHPDVSTGDGATGPNEPQNPEAGESTSTGQTVNDSGGVEAETPSQQQEQFE